MSEKQAGSLEAWIRLNSHPQIGPVRFHRLLAAFGSVDAALGKSVEQWAGLDLRLSLTVLAQARRDIDKFDSARDLTRAQKENVRPIRFVDDGYPLPLLQSEAPPPLVYLKGLWLPQDRFAVAVVGTRKPTVYGLEQSRRFCRGLADAGVSVVSGLALGIDGSAHRATLDSGGRTIAVMGKGLSGIHPLKHAGLADEIVAQGGCLLSQFAMDFPGAAWAFPVRNRVISGLAQGVLVIEGALKSGSMITAHEALEQGRDVFAVPGNVDAPASAGPHRLIQQGARLCNGPEDLLEELRELPQAAQPSLDLKTSRQKPAYLAEAVPMPSLDTQEAALLSLLQTHGILNSEDLAFKSRIPAAQLAGLMTLLEIKGLIKSLPGSRFEALRTMAGAR